MHGDETRSIPELRGERPASGTQWDGDDRLRPGTTVGRYLVLYRLGRGGMGEVYAAYDPDLDRKVAVKFLHHGIDSRRDGELVRREAKTMARLRHRNLVAVHDVGEHEQRTFITMELVDGENLRDWLAGSDRPWRQVLEVFLQAGRGLQAAHAAGIVHRDFKPSNVMVAAGGQARVMDFGLADVAAADPGSERDETKAAGGTPAYLAPEWAAGAGDARSDQYSFCVALYQALYGEHPYPPPKEDKTETASPAVAPGAGLSVPVAGAGVPGWLGKALQRGLRRRPEERFASMGDLLAALDPGRRRSRRRRMTAAAGLVLGVLAVAFVSSRSRTPPCGDAGPRLAGVWDAGQKQAVRTAFAGADAVLGEDTFRRVVGTLDDYAGRWSAMRRQACEATRVSGEQSENLLDRRMLCLDRRLQRLAALTRILAEGDAEVVQKAVLSAQNLPDLDACARSEELMDMTPPPPAGSAERQRLAALQAELARAWALEEAGRYAAGTELVQGRLAEVEGLDYLPLTAEAHHVLGRLLFGAGDLEAATPHLEEGLWAALAASQLEEAARTAADLTSVARLEARFEDGRRWLRRAGVQSRRIGSPGSLDAELLLRQGQLLLEADDFEAAESALLEAREILEEIHGGPHSRLAEVLQGLGVTAHDRARFQEAADYFTEVQAMYVKLLGPDHPRVARAASNLATALRRLRRHGEAKASLERAIAIYERALGPQHPYVGDVLNNLANIHLDRMQYDRAVELLLRAREIYQLAFGTDHPRVVMSLHNLGRAYLSLGRPADSASHLERALEVAEKIRGPEHRQVAAVLHDLSGAYREGGDFERAFAVLARSRAIYQQVLGPESHKLYGNLLATVQLETRRRRFQAALEHCQEAEELLRRIQPTTDPLEVWRQRAETLLAAGRPTEAVEEARKALHGQAQTTEEPTLLAPFQWMLARAQLAAGEDRAAALELARRVAETCAATPGAESQLREVEAWLAEHGS